MRIAFVHDWVVYEGGAEAVLRDLISTRVFSDAKLFVLFSLNSTFTIHDSKGDKNNTQVGNLNSKLDIITAMPKWLNNIFVYFNTRKIPLFSKIFDYRNLMFWFPILCWMLRKKIEKYGANEVVISSFAAVKNVVTSYTSKDSQSTKLATYNLSLGSKISLYLHSPMQYIRENYEDNIQKFSFPIKQLYQFATLYLRPRDKKYRHYNTVLCNSNYTAKLAKQLYGLVGKVSYPHIDKAFFEEGISEQEKNYLVFVGRVQKYVREIGVIIEACNQTNTPLIVIGDGPDMEYAQRIAGPTIIFVGHIDNVQEKIGIVKHAKGLINIAKESFGIGTAEALCLGVPVLGYNTGATPELVDETNGVLINKDSSKGLIYKVQCTIEGIEKFYSKEFDRKSIANTARKLFSTQP